MRSVTAATLAGFALAVAGLGLTGPAAPAATEEPAPPPTVSFIAFGDAGTGSAGQLALRDRMVADAASYDFAVMTGDGAYPVGSVADYAAKFFGVYGPLFQGQGEALPAPTRGLPKPVYAAPGNHEYDTPGATGFHDSFDLPANGPPGVPAEKFYTIDVGGVHFVSFDSHYVVGWNMATPQAEQDAIRDWLVADLDAHAAGVTVVIDHHPAYTGGPHAGESEETAMRSTWFPLFASHGADLLLSGHEHSYQRNHPQSGLTSYVTGGGGGTPTPVTQQPYTAASLSDYHYLDVEVSGCTITTSATLTDGSSFDPWTFEAPTCTTGPPPGPPPEPPPGPTELFADGFESGGFESWSTVRTGPGGAATVSDSPVHDGTYAARLSAAAVTGSYAYARKSLATASPRVVATGDFMVLGEGSAAANVPLIRLFDETGKRILSVFRQNAAGGQLYVQHSGMNHRTAGVIPLEAWARVEVEVELAGSASSVELRLDGNLVHRSLAAALPGTGVLTVQIGNDTKGQAFAVAADDVAVTEPPPGPDPDPDLIFADDFESANYGAWSTVQAGADASATVQVPTEARGGLSPHAAELSATSAPGSFAYARAQLTRPTDSLTAEGDFRVLAEGAPRANVPMLRLFNSTGARILSLYRQNADRDRLLVQYAGLNHPTTGALPLGSWTRLQLRVHLAGDASTVEVRQDGERIHRGHPVSLPGTG